MNARIRLQGLLCISLALAMPITGPISATAQTGKFTPACAERDLEVVNLIEQAGEAEDIASDQLGQMGLAQLQARLSCREGKEAEALALYDRILRLDAITSRTE